MKYNKNEEPAKNSYLQKRSNSYSNFKKNSRDKKNEKNYVNEYIHLSLIIDEENKLSIDFNQNEDVSKLCEKITKKYNLSDKIKDKLKTTIKKQIVELENKTFNGEEDMLENNIVNRLYYESIEKKYLMKMKNEEIKKTREEVELKKFTFTPISSAYNKTNYDKKYEKIEDKLLNDHLKKHKREVDRVLKGINNYVECKQFIYKKNILKNNVIEKQTNTKFNQNEDKKFSFNSISRESSPNINKNLNNLSTLIPSKNYNKTKDKKENCISDGYYSNENDKIIRKSTLKLGTIREVKSNEIRDQQMIKALKRSESIKRDVLNHNKKLSSKKSSDNTNNNIITQNTNSYNNNFNALNSNKNPTTNRNTLETNLMIPEEQPTYDLNDKKTHYINICRKNNLSNSNLSYYTNNTSAITKPRISSMNLQNVFNKQISFGNQSEENISKKSVTSNNIDSTYNNFNKNKKRNAYTIDISDNIQSDKNPTGQMQDVIKNELEKTVNLIKTNEPSPTFNIKNTKLNDDDIIEEVKYDAQRHFSFKDMENFGGLTYSMKNTIEEKKIYGIDEQNKDYNMGNESYAKRVTFENKRKSSLKSVGDNKLINKDITINSNHIIQQQRSVTPLEILSPNAHNISEKRIIKKSYSQSIFDRLYNSHQDIKLKKEKHIENVFKNIYPFRPTITKERPRSYNANSTSKCFSSRQDNKKPQDIFERLYSTSKIQKTKSLFSSSSYDSDIKMAKTQIKTERSKKLISSKFMSIASHRNKDKSYSLRDQLKETHLYNSFLNDTKIKEQLKKDIHNKFSDNINLFKLNNLKEIFENIYKNCKNADDFQNMEKFGITKIIKDNLVIPTCYIINERNLEFNFGNFYLIANEFMNNFIN